MDRQSERQKERWTYRKRWRQKQVLIKQTVDIGQTDGRTKKTPKIVGQSDSYIYRLTELQLDGLNENGM